MGEEQLSIFDLAQRLTKRLEVPILILTGIVLVFFIRDMRAVLIPIAIALVLALLAWPLRRRLSRHMKGWIAGSLVSLLLILIILALAGAGWWVVDRVITQASEMQDEFREMYRQSWAWLSSIGVPEDRLPPETLQEKDWQNVVLTPEARDQITWFLTAGLGGVGWALVVLLLAVGMFILLMLEIPRWDERASEIMGRDAYIRTRDTFEKTAYQIRRYLFAKTISGLVAGIATGITCWFMDVPLAIMWGALTMLMNYIPNVGMFIVGIPMVLLALLQLDVASWLIFLAIIVAIEGVTGNLVDPLVQGNVMLLSPFEVTVGLLFWAWIWGAFGAFLAVPLTAGFVVALRHICRLRPLGKLLSD